MYKLVKLEGVSPERITVIGTGDWRELEAKRDRLTLASFSTDGPCSMAKRRFGVRPA